jgi:predicted dehydrogenase
MIKKNIWIIGTGFMAIEYAKVLKSLQCNFIVIGRGYDNCKLFNELFDISTIEGGLDLYLKSNPEIPEAVINTVGIESLTSTTQRLLEYGVKYILLEKPGFGNPKELEQTVLLSLKNNATVLLAYNRRFYQSVLKAFTIIKNDGGVKSFNFEFTEWSHTIESLDKTDIEHENWFYGNSTHLIDLAFYLGGIPKSITCYKSGKLNWHPAGSIYAGSGETENGAIFSYIANWQSPGRWNLELCTNNFRLIFKPLEKLQIMINGSVNIINDEEINYDLDEKFKPGLYLQLQNFLQINTNSFITISEQYERLNNIYSKINF